MDRARAIPIASTVPAICISFMFTIFYIVKVPMEIAVIGAIINPLSLVSFYEAEQNIYPRFAPVNHNANVHQAARRIRKRVIQADSEN